MSDEEFRDLVGEAVKSIPEEFKGIMENVSLVIEDVPTPYQLHKMRRKGVRGMLLGLYEGVPRTRRGSGYGVGGQLPDKITIFRIPILQISRNKEEVKEQVRETVLHEVGHHFGMSEEQIHKAMKRSG